jgi:hypothetical protein
MWGLGGGGEELWKKLFNSCFKETKQLYIHTDHGYQQYYRVLIE